jgi:polar amino acid transport system substrate-binding protein
MKLIFYILFFSHSLILYSKEYSPCKKALKVGWETARPFQFKEDNVVKGIDIDILKLVMNELHCQLTFEDIPWERHLKEIERGKIDIAAGASETAERAAYGHFTIPYSGESIILYLHKDNRDKYHFKNEQELIKTGIKIGAVAGSYMGPEFEKLLDEKILIKGDNYLEFSNEKQIIDLLISKRIDGFLYGGKKINFHKDIVAHPHQMFEHHANFLLSKKSTSKEIVEEMNKVILKLKQKGILQKIEDTYLKANKVQY